MGVFVAYISITLSKSKTYLLSSCARKTPGQIQHAKYQIYLLSIYKMVGFADYASDDNSVRWRWCTAPYIPFWEPALRIHNTKKLIFTSISNQIVSHTNGHTEINQNCWRTQNIIFRSSEPVIILFIFSLQTEDRYSYDWRKLQMC